jgi:ribosome-associated protein
MLAEGDKAINDFMAEIPVADRQRLRQWVRDGQAERQAAKPPRAARLLFRYLRELLQLDQGHIGIETGVEFDEP